MASHDVLRTSRRPLSEEDRKKVISKIEAYKKLEKQIFQAVQSQNLSEETLGLTSKLLKGTPECDGNPEYYTVWNHRRRVLIKLFEVDVASIHGRLKNELGFQLPLLKRYPKLPQAQAHQFWQEELALDSMMLTRDNRNFHGWNYRRRIIEQLQNFSRHLCDENTSQKPVSNSSISREHQLLEDEFAYTKKMASGSLSNFSAWHQRAKLIPKILQLRVASKDQRAALFDAELGYIREAVLADPWNQSLWFYHDYMITVLMDESGDAWVNLTNQDREEYMRNEITEIKEVLDDTDDCKWIYQGLLSLMEAYLKVDGGNQGSVFTTKDLRNWLSKLETIDPLRKGRWHDWRARLKLE
ncbi:MAG: hypothetical protein Q9159_006590 [Coniocarpon cinnabarinum]